MKLIPRRKKKHQVFGVRLKSEVSKVPQVLETMLNYIELRGMDQHGIFRVSSSKVKLMKLQHDFDKGRVVDFTEYTVHDIANLVKLFYRLLPNPVFTFELYGCFLGAVAAGTVEYKFQLVEKVIRLLPCGHRTLLARTIRFLHKISSRSELNMMTPENLAIIFVPTLMRPKEDDPETTIADFPLQMTLMTTLIENCDHFFPDKTYKSMDQAETSQMKADRCKAAIADRYSEFEVDPFRDQLLKKYSRIQRFSKRGLAAQATTFGVEKYLNLIKERSEAIKAGNCTPEILKTIQIDYSAALREPDDSNE